MKPRFSQFRGAVVGQLHGSRYIASLPVQPDLFSSHGLWLHAMQDTANLWAVINLNAPPVPAFAPPLTLAGGYTLANFTSDKSALEASWATLNKALLDAKQGRTVRDAAFAPVFERLKQYRQAVHGVVPAGSALLESLRGSLQSTTSDERPKTSDLTLRPRGGHGGRFP